MLRILLTIGVFAVLPVFAAAQTRVIDGDTLELGGTVYRLNGIDAPEFGQTCGRWPMKWAWRWLNAGARRLIRRPTI